MCIPVFRRRPSKGGARAIWPRVLGAAIITMTAAAPAAAQTDYYNLDRGRPLRTEDAIAVERHALEWQMAPVRLSGARGAGSVLAAEPELAWGALPRTQVEVGIPLQRWQRGNRVVVGAAGVDVSVLYALNAETMRVPGLAVATHVLIPAGPFGAERTYPTFTAIATRTLPLGRVHVNASWTAGAAPGLRSDAGPAHELARWEGGIAVDRAFPLKAFLLGAELVAREPMGHGADDGIEWSAATGMRYQVGPRLGLDVGVGRELSSHGEWFITFGSAVSFGLLHRLRGTR